MARSDKSTPCVNRYRVGAFGVLCLGLVAATPALSKADVTGVWYDDTGKGAVHLQTCGSQNQSVCGHIVWLSKAAGRPGKPIRDSLNPDPRRRNKPICGLQIIGRLKPQTDGSWDNGWIYDPKKGQSFDVAVQRLSSDRLRITGYMGTKLLSQSFVWKRAPAGLAPCNR